MTELQKKKLENGREYRNMTMRALEDKESFTVEGYAATFDTQYLLGERPGYKYYERIAAGAFDGCDMSDVIMQYNHEGRVFARTRNSTLTLAVDGTGLLVRAELGGTEIGRELYDEIKGGYTDRMSFGFVVGEDEKAYTEDRESGLVTCLRTIKKIKKLYDVSAVSIPANDMTSISARSLFDGAMEEIMAWENKKKKLKLLLEV